MNSSDDEHSGSTRSGWSALLGNPALVAPALVLFLPLGLYLLWRHTGWREPVKLLSTVISVLLALLFTGPLVGLNVESEIRRYAAENLWVGAALVLAATSASVGFMLYLRRHAPSGGFFSDGDRTSAIFGIGGTMFSVLLALVILLSVETYRTTESHTNAEADAVLQQFQLAALFPSRDQYAIQSELICYGRSVSELEWAVMRDDSVSPEVDGWVRSIDSHLETVDINGSKAEAAFQAFLSQNLERQEERRGRIEGASGAVPPAVWPILLIGAAATIAFLIAYADRQERVQVQIFQVGIVTFVLGASLLLISALDNPFGNIPGRIDPSEMGDAMTFMENRLATSIDADDLRAVLPCDDQGVPLIRGPELVTHPAGSTMAEIVEREKFVIGITYGLPLFGEIDPLSGNLSGFDMGIAQEIARELGLREDQVEYVDVLVADRIPALEEGRVDMVVLSVTITPERAERVEFSRPYFLAGQSILVTRSTSTIASLRDLPGHEICVVPESTSHIYISEQIPEAELVPMAGFRGCAIALREGEVDAVVTDDIVLAGFAASDPELMLTGGQFTTEPYGVAVPKGQTDLAEFVDGVIARMIDDGRWGKLYYEYLGGIPGIASVSEAKRALEELEDPLGRGPFVEQRDGSAGGR